MKFVNKVVSIGTFLLLGGILQVGYAEEISSWSEAPLDYSATFEDYEEGTEIGEGVGAQVEQTLNLAQYSSINEERLAGGPGIHVVTELACSYLMYEIRLGCSLGCHLAFPADPSWPKRKKFQNNLKINVCMSVCKARIHKQLPFCVSTDAQAGTAVE